MSNKTQTSVDWFFDKIKSHFEHDGDLLESITFAKAIAKQKEKEQMIKLWQGGINSTEEGGKSFDQYYTQTYGEI